MQLEWHEHATNLTSSISALFGRSALLDVTLAAQDGKRLKAHRLVLAAASEHFKVPNYTLVIFFGTCLYMTYLQTLLCDEDVNDASPIIYFRDVGFAELECLVQFIYCGKTEVAGPQMSAFLDLAKSLGVKGFGNTNDVDVPRTPNKRKMEEDEDKENASPKKSPLKHANSEPLYVNQVEAQVLREQKKRKLQVRSLDEQRRKPSTASTSPSSPSKSLSKASSTTSSLLNSFWMNTPAVTSSPAGKTDDVFKKPFTPPLPPPPPYPSSSSSQSSTANSEAIQKERQKNLSSLDGLDPNELAAKGATLLHHLAVWMLEEKRMKEEEKHRPLETSTTSVDVSTVEKASSSSNIHHHHRQIASLPAQLRSRNESGANDNRPDSGFDSKDEASRLTATPTPTPPPNPDTIAEVETEASLGSSPEVGEISRQGRNRQPIFRKRRI